MLHLEDKNTSYREHFNFAFKAGLILLLAGAASIVHAVVPQLFAEYSERQVHALSRLARRRSRGRH